MANPIRFLGEFKFLELYNICIVGLNLINDYPFLARHNLFKGAMNDFLEGFKVAGRIRNGLPGQKYSYCNNFNSYIQAPRGIITFVAASLWMFA